MIKFQVLWNIVFVVALYSMSLTGVWWRWNQHSTEKAKTRETARDGWKWFDEIVLQCIRRRHHLLLAGVWIGIRKREGVMSADEGSEESKWRRRRGNGAEIDGIHLPLLYYWTSVRERELKGLFLVSPAPGPEKRLQGKVLQREREREKTAFSFYGRSIEAIDCMALAHMEMNGLSRDSRSVGGTKLIFFLFFLRWPKCLECGIEGKRVLKIIIIIKKKKGGQRVLSGSPEVDNGWIPLLVEALYSPKRRAAAEAAELSLSLSWKYYPGEEGKKKKGDGRLPFSI